MNVTVVMMAVLIFFLFYVSANAFSMAYTCNVPTYSQFYVEMATN